MEVGGPAESVRAENLSKTYVIGSVKYPALGGVNFSLKKGEFAAIAGPSGSGKTTLLLLLGTLARPDSGEVFIDDMPVSKLGGRRLAEFRNRKLGFVFQSYNLVPGLTAEENVQLPLVACGVQPAERRKRARLLLDELGLGGRFGNRPGELSGGEQQRVAIARALVNQPSLILADEPTGNLDSKSAGTVTSILRRETVKRKVTTVMVTHNMEITKYCDRVISLRDGLIEREEANTAPEGGAS